MRKDVDVETAGKERIIVETKRMNEKVGMTSMKERVVMKEEPISEEEEVAVAKEEPVTTGEWAAVVSKRTEVQQRAD